MRRLSELARFKILKDINFKPHLHEGRKRYLSPTQNEDGAFHSGRGLVVSRSGAQTP
jgi:hypothetical protein